MKHILRSIYYIYNININLNELELELEIGNANYCLHK